MIFNYSILRDPSNFFQIDETPSFSNQKNKLNVTNSSNQIIRRKKSLQALDPKNKPIRTETEDKLSYRRSINCRNLIQKFKTTVQFSGDDQKQNRSNVKKSREDSRHKLQATSKIQIKMNCTSKMQSARNNNIKQSELKNKKKIDSCRQVDEVQKNKININLTEVLREYNSRTKSKQKECQKKNEQIQKIFILGLKKRITQFSNQKNLQKNIPTLQNNHKNKHQSNLKSIEKENFQKPKLMKLNLKPKRVSKHNLNRYY